MLGLLNRLVNAGQTWMRVGSSVFGDPARTLSQAAAIVEAASAGELTPSEAGELMKIVECYARTLQVSDFEARLERLENQKGAAR